MKKRFGWWAFLLFLFSVNAWILIERNNGYKYFPYKTYSELYTTDSSLCYEDVVINHNLLQLKFSQPLTEHNWKLYTDSSFTSDITATTNQLSLPLKSGLHSYKLISAHDSTGLPISIVIDHTPHENEHYDNEFISSNIPGPDVEPIALNLWKLDKSIFPKSEIEAGVKLLTDSIHLLSNDDDITKTIKIGLYLRHLPLNTKGIDPTEVAAKSPWEQIRLAQQYKANLNCGNYAAMFYFLGGLAGLVTRGIIYSGPDGSWHYASHYLNEVYLHKQQQWALVDNSNNIYLPYDDVRFYNAADVKKMTDVNGFSNKVCYDLNNNSVRIVPYSQVSNLHSYYNQNAADIKFAHNTSYKFSFFNNLWQFYIPIRDHDLYSDRKSNNTFKLIVKTIFILALLVSLFWYLAWEFNKKKNKHKTSHR
jgi:hypothetical protein